MTKEERAISLTLLISFLYGLSFLIQSGVFILPMPLFPLFSLVAGGYICISNFQVSRVSAGLFISALFSKFLLSTFFLMFVLREQSYISFLKSAVPDVLKLLYYALIIVGCLKLLLNALHKRRLIYAITFLVIFSIAFQLRAQYLVGLGFVFVFVLTKIEKDELQVFGLIPFLLAVFEFSEWVFTGFIK